MLLTLTLFTTVQPFSSPCPTLSPSLSLYCSLITQQTLKIKQDVERGGSQRHTEVMREKFCIDGREEGRGVMDGCSLLFCLSRHRWCWAVDCEWLMRHPGFYTCTFLLYCLFNCCCWKDERKQWNMQDCQHFNHCKLKSKQFGLCLVFFQVAVFACKSQLCSWCSFIIDINVSDHKREIERHISSLCLQLDAKQAQGVRRPLNKSLITIFNSFFTFILPLQNSDIS